MEAGQKERIQTRKEIIIHVGIDLHKEIHTAVMFDCWNQKLTRIENGFNQGAETVIIDGRKTGLTLEQANTIINRALGKYGGTLPGKVEIWTTEGILRR